MNTQYAGPAYSLAALRVVEALQRFVAQGLADPYSLRHDAGIPTLGLLLQNQLLSQAQGGGLVPDGKALAKAWEPGAWPSALQKAHRAFLESFGECARLYFSKLAPPWLGLVDEKAEVANALEILGVGPVDEPHEKDPVVLAYEMARFNVTRCEQRIVSLYLLGNMARNPGSGTLHNSVAQTEFEMVSRQLWNARSLHLSRVLAFGTLLGGGYLEQNKEMVKAMYGPGISVIEVMQVDGITPGRWPAASEEKLRKAIAKA